MKKKLLSILLVLTLVACVSATHMAAASVNITNTFKADQKFKKMVNDAGQWWMLNILYENKKTVSLTKKNKLQMAAFTATVNSNYIQPKNGGTAYMTKKQLQKSYYQLFGTTTNLVGIDKTNNPDNSTRTVYLKNNKLYVNLGDWGDAGPSFTITKVVKSGSTYTATIKMYMSGAGMKKTLKGTATLKVKKNNKSSYGYKIVGLYVKAK